MEEVNKNDSPEVKEEKKKYDFSFKKVKTVIKKIPHKPVIILVILLFIALVIPKKLPSIFTSSNYSKIEKICSLATIEAYYHDVASKTQDATTLGKIFGNIGYKKYWLEYDVIVQYGIDAKKVKIDKPNIKNEVKVHLPEAEVLGEPIWVQDYIQDPVTDTGFLTSVSGEDKTEAVENSIKELKEAAQNDKEHLELARERAKLFFEKYIISAGREVGVEYKVIFED